MPIFFDGKFTVASLLGRTAVAALAFSLAASAVYCLNDVIDRHRDAAHPTKRHRPVASGKVSVPTAVTLAAMCLAGAALLAGLWLPPQALWLLAGYFTLNVVYSLCLKHITVVDVLTVAVFYVLRVLMGGLAAEVTVSQWLIIMTFLLALFLTLGKRRDDVLIYDSSNVAVRKVVQTYNIEFVNMALTMVATITMVAYLIYTISPEVTARFHNHYVYGTAIFVLAGLMRYLQLAIVQKKSDSPTGTLLHDTFTQLCVALWVLSFVIIIYVR